MIKTRIVTYYFDTDKETDKIGYHELVKHINDVHKIDYPFTTHGRVNKEFEEKLEALDIVELETKYVFSDQWNTSENSGNLRLFDWKEHVFPNRRIKSGYYLVQTDEMRQIRQDNTRCHYCGKMSAISEVKDLTCPKCNNSGYLLDLSTGGGGFKKLK